MSATTSLLIVAGLLLANAFFVGAEFALVSARRSQLEPRAEAGSRRARGALWAMERVSLMMAGAQLGITVCSLALGAVGEPAIAHLLEGPFERLGLPDQLRHPIALGFALILIVGAHVIVGEMVPKNLTLAAPDRAALLLGPSLARLVRATRPVIYLLNALANGVLRLLGVQPRDEVSSAYTQDQVAGLVAQSRRAGLMDPGEHELVTGALQLANRTAHAVAIPLRDVVTVDPGITPARVEALACQHGLLRFPVRAAGDELDGCVYLKDLLDIGPHGREQPIASTRIRRLPTVRGDDSLADVLTSLRHQATYLARVVDDTGRTSGVVTLDRVLTDLVATNSNASPTSSYRSPLGSTSSPGTR